VPLVSTFIYRQFDRIVKIVSKITASGANPAQYRPEVTITDNWGRSTMAKYPANVIDIQDVNNDLGAFVDITTPILPNTGQAINFTLALSTVEGFNDNIRNFKVRVIKEYR